MTYKLLALDMDGTLLTSDKKVLPRTRNALEQLAERGVPVAFCTGRNVLELMDYPHELHFIRYGVLSSGAVVYDFAKRKALVAHTLDTDVTLRMLELASPERPMVHIMSATHSVVRPDDFLNMESFGMGVYQTMFKRICTMTDDLSAWLESHPNQASKINFYHRDVEARLRTRHRFEEAGLPLTLADAEETSLECSPLGVSKAEGLRTLAAHLGITTDDIVAVGDSDNDLAALSVVAMPVAMGNATPAVMRVAKLVVSDNDHDGIVEAIDQLF